MGFPVLHLQVDRLVFLVVRARARHARQDVEADLIVGFGVGDLWHCVCGLGGGVVAGGFVFERPGGFAAEDEGFQPGIHDPAVEAQGGVEAGPHVADLLEFGPDGRGAEGVLVVVEEDRAAVGVCGEGGVGCFSGEHAAAHGRVGAFDLGHVEEAGRVSDQGAAGKGAFGDRLEAAFVESAGGIGYAFSALQDVLVKGMLLHLLKFAVRGKPGVWVVEPNDKTDGHHIVAKMVKPAAAIGVTGKRIAHGVHNLTLSKLLRWYLPHLFQPKPIRLRLRISPQIVLLDDLFRERAMTAFSEESDTSVELHPALKRGFGFARARDSQIVGGNAFDAAICRVVDDFRGSESRIDLHAHLFSALSKPFTELIQADDIIAVIVHLRRSGNWDCGVLREETHLVIGGRRGIFKARVVVFRQPVGKEFINGGGLDDIARDNVSPNLPSFLKQKHSKVLIASFIGQLFEANRSAESSGACIVVLAGWVSWRTVERLPPPTMQTSTSSLSRSC